MKGRWFFWIPIILWILYFIFSKLTNCIGIEKLGIITFWVIISVYLIINVIYGASIIDNFYDYDEFKDHWYVQMIFVPYWFIALWYLFTKGIIPLINKFNNYLDKKLSYERKH